MSPLGSTTDASAKNNTRGPCLQLKTAKVTRVTNGRIPIAYDERHRATPMAEQHSALAHDIGHVVRTFCPMWWKSWKVMLEETKNTVRNQLSTNYNLEDMDEDMFAYLNRLFSKHYKQWKSDLHQFSNNLMIHRSLLRRVVQRSWRTDKIVRFGFAVIFKRQAMWCDLPQHNACECANDDVDLPTNEEEWESESDDSDDIYSSSDKD
ncbi:hypothetical protein C1H46_008391 [Malus baccata]|uniref:Uncharacterized protein n=1 Tax=Malus baccata TaxID=106549 RepID=A0A540N4H8_MALBA|nr:hypothetical protein C1H46_008391 [Malus baccata]